MLLTNFYHFSSKIAHWAKDGQISKKWYWASVAVSSLVLLAGSFATLGLLHSYGTLSLPKELVSLIKDISNSPPYIGLWLIAVLGTLLGGSFFVLTMCNICRITRKFNKNLENRELNSLKDPQAKTITWQQIKELEMQLKDIEKLEIEFVPEELWNEHYFEKHDLASIEGGDVGAYATYPYNFGFSRFAIKDINKLHSILVYCKEVSYEVTEKLYQWVQWDKRSYLISQPFFTGPQLSSMMRFAHSPPQDTKISSLTHITQASGLIIFTQGSEDSKKYLIVNRVGDLEETSREKLSEILSHLLIK